MNVKGTDKQLSTQRYFLELAYHGGAYHGWQIQKNAITVQECVEKALRILHGRPVETIGCGRTDTGVHARQMFAHMDIQQPIADVSRFLHQLNALLPHDIAAKTIIPVSEEAHARFDAINRTYHYQIHFKKDPFFYGLSSQIRPVPNLQSMNNAAEILYDYEDFRCFSKTNTQVATYLCRIEEAFWQASEQRMVFQITANRFLRNMVRAIVGTLLEIGHGRQPVEHMRHVIESQSRRVAGASVPAEGLYLHRVQYPENLFQNK